MFRISTTRWRLCGLRRFNTLQITFQKQQNRCLRHDPQHRWICWQYTWDTCMRPWRRGKQAKTFFSLRQVYFAVFQLWRTFSYACRCRKLSKPLWVTGVKTYHRAFIVVVNAGLVPFWRGSTALFDDALTRGKERGGRWCPLCAALRQPPSTAVMQKWPRSRWLCVKDPTSAIAVKIFFFLRTEDIA